jgi:hypothetical protein
MAKGYPKPYRWRPRNPEKYIGNVNEIWVRSSWEKKFLIWVDDNPSIIKYGSEEMIIYYISPLDGKTHRYYPDYVLLIKQTSGALIKAIVEIKPNKQTKPPNKPKRITPSYINEIKTWSINEAKWKAAEIFAKQNNMKFIILDEYSLDIKQRK